MTGTVVRGGCQRAVWAERGASTAARWAWAALVGLTVLACTGPPATVVPFDSPITLAPGERARLAGSDFFVTFERVVRDDRCPVGVFCIHFGDARVAFRAAGAGVDTTVVLSTADTAASAMIGAYRIELDALAPFKQQEAEIPAAAYRATVRVSRSDSLPAGRP